MVLMLDDIYSVMVTFIGNPVNDAQGFMLYSVCVMIGLFMFFTVITMFVFPFKKIVHWYK